MAQDQDLGILGAVGPDEQGEPAEHAAAFGEALSRDATGGAGSGPDLIQGAGLLTVAAGLLRRDHLLLDAPGEPGASWHSNAHDAISGLLYASLVVVQLVLARRFRRDPAWRPWCPWLLAGAAATGVLLIAYAADVTGPAAAILQRVAVTLPQAARRRHRGPAHAARLRAGYGRFRGQGEPEERTAPAGRRPVARGLELRRSFARLEAKPGPALAAHVWSGGSEQA